MSRNVVIGEVMMNLGGMDLTGGEVSVWREIRPHQFQNVSLVASFDKKYNTSCCNGKTLIFYP